MLHFRKRLHVTVRDLRSALAFTLFGKKNCNEIKKEIQEGNYQFIERYYYNAIFSATEKDRVLGLLNEFDVGKTATPQIDSRLSFTRPKTSEFRGLFLNLGNARVALWEEHESMKMTWLNCFIRNRDHRKKGPRKHYGSLVVMLLLRAVNSSLRDREATILVNRSTNRQQSGQNYCLTTIYRNSLASLIRAVIRKESSRLV